MTFNHNKSLRPAFFVPHAEGVMDLAGEKVDYKDAPHLKEEGKQHASSKIAVQRENYWFHN